MPYTPDPFDSAEPQESQSVESAALEFRTLKPVLKRTLRFPAADLEAYTGELPAAASRAGKFLAFDSVTGQPIAGPLLSAWTITQAQIAAVETVATNIAAVNTVATNLVDIQTANANIVSIDTVATNIAAVLTVAADIANVNAVAADLANIDAVAAEIPNLATKVSKTADTGSAIMPAGTTAQRDGVPAFGYVRANSTLTQMEWWNGSAWTPIGAGATGGPGNAVFFENDQTVTVDYTIPATKNAMTAGPITIDTGITVTVSTGATWTVV